MKTFVIGLDCAAPEILFNHPGLNNIRALMERGCYGRLESVIPPITVPAWMCMSTSQDPGSLGVYGFRNRKDYSYHGLSIVNSSSIQQTAIWDVLGSHHKEVVVVGVPPSYPPRRMNGVNVGCFMTPDTKTHDYTYPASVRQEIDRLVGEYPVDVKGFRTNNKEWLRDQIYDMTRKHFEVIRYLMVTLEWDYFQFVEIGVDRVHHGAQRLEGGFCVNEWLRREGLLVLKEPVAKPTPFSPSLVDWERTRVWSEGGYYARVFFNVEGREPQGIVPESEYDDLIQDMTARFHALRDDRGEPMGSLVFQPRDLYRNLRNVPPDLIVHFGALYWRSIGGLGYDSLYLQENDTGPDDCNHAQFGSFLLAAPNLPVRGEMEGMHLLDIAPTLLDLAGFETPESMQGCSLLARSRSEVGCGRIR